VPLRRLGRWTLADGANHRDGDDRLTQVKRQYGTENLFRSRQECQSGARR